MTVPGGTETSVLLQDGESRAGIPTSQTKELPTVTLTQYPGVLMHLLIPWM